MAPGDPAAGKLPPEPVGLPLLALSRPQNALTAARFVLDGQPGAYAASLAHQAIGIVPRDHGDVPGAFPDVRAWISPGPKNCLRPAARIWNTPRPGITTGLWR